MTSDVKTTKANKWVSHIRDYAEKNGMSYRQAMRDEGCKTAYKSPEPEPTPEPTPERSPERSPSPVRPPSPEPVETKPKKGRGKKLADPMPMPALVRSEHSEVPTILRKERVKRSPKMVPT
jgi:hypothetical protein